MSVCDGKFRKKRKKKKGRFVFPFAKVFLYQLKLFENYANFEGEKIMLLLGSARLEGTS